MLAFGTTRPSRTGSWFRTVLVATLLLGLLVMHGGLAAQAGATPPSHISASDRSPEHMPSQQLGDEGGTAGEDHDHEGGGHQDDTCAAVLRDDGWLVSYVAGTWPATTGSCPEPRLEPAASVWRPPDAPCAWRGPDLSALCVWRR